MDPTTLFLLVVLAGVGFSLYFFLGSFWFGAGYEPTSRRTVSRMLEMAQVRASDVVVDLGAGTGAIVFAAAKERGARAIAVERDPLRCAILRGRRRCSKVQDRVVVVREDLFVTPLARASVVALFLWPSAMERLRPRLEAELAPGTRVISNCHPIVGWSPTEVDRRREVFLYRVPARAGATAGGT